MNDGAPASLTSSLLARKGQARPAALPEDNYSPFRKGADDWRESGQNSTAKPADPDAPTLFDALDDDASAPSTKVDDVEANEAAGNRSDASQEERPEATLSQVRVQRTERVRLQPAVNDAVTSDEVVGDAALADDEGREASPEGAGSADAGSDAVASEETASADIETVVTVETGSTAENAELAVGATDSVATENASAAADAADPVDDRTETAGAVGESASEAGSEDFISAPDIESAAVVESVPERTSSLSGDDGDDDGNGNGDGVVAEAAVSVESGPAQSPVPPLAMPVEVAAAALQARPPVWRRHATTFGLSFLVGGALAFVGWSIYSKGDPGQLPPVLPDKVALSADQAAVGSATSKEGAARPGAVEAKRSAVAAGTAMPAPDIKSSSASIPVAAAVSRPGDAASDAPRVLSVRFAEDGRATIVGTANAGGEVVLLDNGALLATVKADKDGIWSYLGDAALADGSHKFAVAAVATTVAAKVSAGPISAGKMLPVRTAPGTGGLVDDANATSSALPRPLAPPEPVDQPVRDVAVAPDRSQAAPEVPDSGDESLPEQTEFDPSLVPLPAEKRGHASAGEPVVRYVVQLASVPTKADALRFWEELGERRPGLTDKHSLLVHPGVLQQGRTVFRVRAGPFDSRKAAQQACRSFRPAIKDCLVVRRQGTRS